MSEITAKDERYYCPDCGGLKPCGCRPVAAAPTEDAEYIVRAANAYPEHMRLLKESLDRFCHDEEGERIPLKEACYCTSTGTEYGDLICLPCKLAKVLARTEQKPHTHEFGTEEES